MMQHAEPNTLPLVGGAIRLAELPHYMDWLVADQRDLEIQDPGYPHYLDGDWTAEAKEGKARLDDAGYAGRLGIHAAYDGLLMFVQDRLIRDVIRTRYLQSLEFGAALGATQMVIHSPFIAFGSALATYAPAAYRQPVIDNVHHILETVLPVAQAQGCTLVIECIMDKNPLPLVELVRSFNSEFVQMSIDTGHAAVMEREGGAPIYQWVVEAGEWLGHVHLQDVDGHADRHWAVGDGIVQWPTFFRALRTLHHKPRLVLEVAEVMRSFNWLAAHGLAR